jgi:hypothetical protein
VDTAPLPRRLGKSFTLNYIIMNSSNRLFQPDQALFDCDHGSAPPAPKRRRLDESTEAEPQIQGSGSMCPLDPSSSMLLSATCTTYLDWNIHNHPSQLDFTSSQPCRIVSSQTNLICQQFSEPPFPPYYGVCPQSADDSARPMSTQAEEERNETVCFGMVTISHIITQ